VLAQTTIDRTVSAVDAFSTGSASAGPVGQ
jgi:hypothetical protein